MKLRSRLLVTLLAAALVPVLILACGGGGGGGDGGGAAPPTATVDQTSMTNALARMDAYVPGCTDSPAAGRVASAREASAVAITAARGVARALDLAGRRAAGRAAYAVINPTFTDTGTCLGAEGTAVGTGTHANGVTTGTVTFNAYCIQDLDTGEQTTMNGQVAYEDRGQPSPTGPQRMEFGASTPTPLRVQSSLPDGEDTTVNLAGLHYTVGTVGQDPTPAAPDALTIGTLQVTDNKAGHALSLANFSATTALDGTATLVDVASARLTTAEDGSVDVRTGQPLRFDDLAGLVEGSVVITGANGGTAELTVAAGSPNTFTVTVGGAPMAVNLDCSQALGTAP